MTTDDDRWPVEAARAADAKGAEDVVVLDVGPVLSICGHFVLATGSNNRQVRTIAEEVEEKVARAGGPKPLRVEGLDEQRWVLLDYGDFVVHVFLDDARGYYDLDRLWADVARVDWKAADAAAAEAGGTDGDGEIGESGDGESDPSGDA